MKKVNFVKMHGAGNDYIYLDGIHNRFEDLPDLARKISDRHFGIGSDGLVIITDSESADFGMRMFNADGSEAQMCGNACRCIAKYLYERHFTKSRCITLETLAGIKILILNVNEDNKVESVRVDMGIPELQGKKRANINNKEFDFEAVSVGNPHGVLYVTSLDDGLVLGLGPLMETAPCWPEKANIEFVKILSPDRAEVRVWERGSGETLACGTGACAVLAASVAKGLLQRKADIILPGGTLSVEWDVENGHLYLSGPAEFIAEGEYFFN